MKNLPKNKLSQETKDKILVLAISLAGAAAMISVYAIRELSKI